MCNVFGLFIKYLATSSRNKNGFSTKSTHVELYVILVMLKVDIVMENT